MNRLHVTKLGFAAGTTVAIIYSGCIIISLALSNEAVAKFFGSLAHSFDFTAIIRKAPITFSEAITGIIEWFIIAWLMGSCIAVIYNAALGRNK
ncbi:hypothetical protein DIU31_027850 [Mucilaginibacter rubeus]|uniref:Uncharacterized protein n=1 Tax=Mucilaginibacter rubeus TaxID=2027860 RepID=A0AAE6JKL8_9SPHI|nr:DUF5676 family membrane protein [Mucilaginibacter rubeus]QEM07133.1 hypothetical protein DIU31_027850 [Mucilaginibacter rubeus]QTE43722.1 hypothetical protein J3L19_33215 [Mucilaginibacter rubeus]QTE50321.1 hypothetical protein J3L21_33170 [Mucilaginibacter rubeus]QTE55408.1 hypothetical protein J3L23_24785 [Mucilaginibacter rubeus]QTE65130.1 hypothetical protein J3L22_09035 [Mucilaginibacter rubeus]